ncbi:MAG: YbaB/EbfC family nucleoid-associated protein [Acidobacteriota bacterium]|nr:YbaB/EbfC family nucleoid-associated protein [Blastocatellia bacterium]MDW8238095.1 YbaB/EbfC family nucleoid-associated protein [Acidobacteriota bacterium]
MKFPGGMNMKKLMQEAQRIQEDLQRALEEMRIEATAGGGMVTVVMSGHKQIVSLKIDPEVMTDADMLHDLLIAAFNECSRKVDEAVQQQTMKNLNLPGLGGFFS